MNTPDNIYTKKVLETMPILNIFVVSFAGKSILMRAYFAENIERVTHISLFFVLWFLTQSFTKMELNICLCVSVALDAVINKSLH